MQLSITAKQTNKVMAANNLILLMVGLGLSAMTMGSKNAQQDDQNCTQVTMSNCFISEEDIINQGRDISSDLCQYTCDVLTHCILFRYTRADQYCQLLNRDFRQNCKVIGSARIDNLYDCLNADLNGCSAFIEEECVFDGSDLAFSPPDGEISTPYLCESLCKEYESLGCNYWVYDLPRLSCRLLTSSERTCVTLSGPQAPTMEECDVTIPE